MFEAKILTLFPDMFPGPLGFSLAGKARGTAWDYTAIDIRGFCETKYKSVDDQPFGGGNGLVMSPEIMGRAIDASFTDVEEIIYFSPKGRRFDQHMARHYAGMSKLGLICGRYEGLDERVIKHYNITEISVGDFVLSGGEPAAYIFMDACIRLLPGVLENSATVNFESFAAENYLLEYPQYTRPQNWRGLEVPEILLSGDHKKIAKWRQEYSEELTKDRRPDLWASYLADKQK